MRKNAVLLALAVCAPFAAPEAALACGGCIPVIGQPAPVTAHRMAVALSPIETTLWDQIEYSGSPEDFVWVLPIAGTSRVELADNGFFEALTEATAITLESPLPPRTFCSDECPDFGLFSFSDASPTLARESDGGRPPVEVHFEGVVGPYETATIGSEDPSALLTWLRDRDYGIDDSILPIIEHYVGLGMNFVVLRMSPSSNVTRMQPVRVTVPGLMPTFPLRMVAAGIENHVALELFVFAESRIETGNFGNAEVDRAAITFDWATRTFDYEARFDEARFAGEGEGTNWVAEFAGTAPASIASFRSTDAATGDEHSAADDWAVVARALEEPYLTRLRTDLQIAELDEDLMLRMSGGGDIGTHVRVTRELNRVEPGCETTCAAGTGTGPGGTSLRGSGDLRCGVGVGVGAGAPGGGLAAMLAGLAMLVIRRRAR